MTIKIIIVENPFIPASHELIETDDICAAIAERFPAWPATARIFDLADFDFDRAISNPDASILSGRDVTPRDDAGIERLARLQGPLMITVPPALPVWAIIAIAVVVSVAIAFLLMPKIPSLGNQQQISPNNALSSRTNQARVNGRIPDIFGTVRAIPDLIAVPYSMFANNVEYEIALFCLGRGQYVISDICDDKTPVTEISGMSVQVYGPGKSPNNASPDTQIGAVIDSPMYNIRRSNAANGQTLIAPNEKSYQGVSNIRFGSDYTVQIDPSSGVKLTTYFALGDDLTIEGSSYTYSAVTFDGDGAYLITGISDYSITVDVTGGMVAEWAKIAGFPSSVTGYLSSNLYVAAAQSVGPIIEMIEDGGKLILNFEAQNGLYKDDGKNQFPADVEVQVSVSHVDSMGGVISGPIDYLDTLPGSATSKGTVAITMTIDPGFVGISSSVIKRLTPKDRDFTGQVADEVKLRDFYSAGPVTQSDFGNVTTVFAKTIATAGALVVKERKLNMLATRMVGSRLSETSFGGDLIATDSADDIFCAIAVDPYIGGRSVSELDLNSIYGAIEDVADYFADPLAKEFGYTFDQDGMSFEETAATVAQAAFCSAYRQGSQFKLSFERATEDSVMLFNARNTIPSTQKRSVRFGVLEDHDGAEIDYVAPDDGVPLKFTVPVDMSATSAMAVDIPGIRSEFLAYLHTWRTWNKMRFQNVALELEATQESVLTIRNDRVLAADLTRSQAVIGGEIEAIDGVLVTLSDEANLDPYEEWSMYIQHIDESVEILACFATGDPYQVTLSAVPRISLSLDPLNFTRAKYLIVSNNDAGVRAFLVNDRQQASPFTQTMSLINYTFLYYQNDELELWLSFGTTAYADSSPHHRDGSPVGAGGLITDAYRGIVYNGSPDANSITFPDFAPPQSYTKAVWIRRADESGCGVLENAHEVFGLDASTVFQVGHGGADLMVDLPDADTWYHVVATYDEAGAEMILYLNGIMIGSASVASRTIAQLVGFDNMPGRATDLRLWRRALSEQEVKAVYRSTVIDSSVGGALSTEDDVGITTEDGHGISWG